MILRKHVRQENLVQNMGINDGQCKSIFYFHYRLGKFCDGNLCCIVILQTKNSAVSIKGINIWIICYYLVSITIRKY